MPSNSGRRRLVAVIAFVVPLGLVKGTSIVMNQPLPATATAAPDAPAPPAATQPGGGWTPAARAAADRARELASRPFRDPPLYFTRVAEPEPVPEPEPEPEPEIPVVITLDASVQMLMSTETEEIALIDGRPYRIGETLRTGEWIVQAINSRDRAVVFRHIASGRIEVRHVPITR